MAFWWESSNQWVKNQRWWTLTLPQLTPLWAGVLISISTELDPQTWLHNTAIIHCCSEQWHVEFPGHRDSSSQPSVRTRALLKSLWSHRWVQQLFSIKCGKGKQLLQYSMMAMTKGDKGNYLAAGNKQEGQILPNRLIFFQQAWFQKGSENKSSENRFKLETRYQNEHKLNRPFKEHHENRFMGIWRGKQRTSQPWFHWYSSASQHEIWDEQLLTTLATDSHDQWPQCKVLLHSVSTPACTNLSVFQVSLSIFQEHLSIFQRLSPLQVPRLQETKAVLTEGIL